MGGKIVWHQVVLLVVMSLLLVLRLLSGVWLLDINLAWWAIGGILGFLFVFMDRFVYALVTNPNDVLSVKIKDLFSNNKIVEGAALTVAERDKQQNLVMRSALFLVVWMVLAVWTASSVAGLFAKGLVLGLGTHLVFDLVWDYFNRPSGKLELWFWQIKRNLSEKEKVGFVLVAALFYLVIVWYL